MDVLCEQQSGGVFLLNTILCASCVLNGVHEVLKLSKEFSKGLFVLKTCHFLV